MACRAPVRLAGVYVLKFPIGERVYVGASWNVQGRVHGHLDKLALGRAERALQAAWDDCGGEGVSVIIRLVPLVADARRLAALERDAIRHWVGKVGEGAVLNRSPFRVAPIRQGGCWK